MGGPGYVLVHENAVYYEAAGVARFQLPTAAVQRSRLLQELVQQGAGRAEVEVDVADFRTWITFVADGDESCPVSSLDTVWKVAEKFADAESARRIVLTFSSLVQGSRPDELAFRGLTSRLKLCAFRHAASVAKVANLALALPDEAYAFVLRAAALEPWAESNPTDFNVEGELPGPSFQATLPHLKQFPSITCLNMSRNDATPTDITALAAQLQFLPALQRLLLGGNHGGAALADALLPALASLTALSDLRLGGNLHNTSLPIRVAFAKGLSVLVALPIATLDISHVRVNDTVAGDIFLNLVQLESLLDLDLRSWTPTTGGTTKIFNYLPKLTTLTALRLHHTFQACVKAPSAHYQAGEVNSAIVQNCLSSLVNLRYLDLSATSLDADHTAHFPNRMPALEHLDISAAAFRGQPASLTHVIPNYTSLRHLAVRRSGVGNSAMALAHALTRLTSLDLSFNITLPQNLPQLLTRFTMLASLSLGGTSGTSMLMFHSQLGQFLPMMTALTSLDMNCCNFGAKGLVELSRGLQSNPPRLRRLNLAFNNIQGDELRIFVGSLGKLPALTYLNMRGNRLSPPGLTMMAEALKGLPELAVLDLTGNMTVQDQGATALAENLQDSTSLQELWLGGQNGIGRDGALALASYLQPVPTLNVLALRLIDIPPVHLDGVKAALFSMVNADGRCPSQIG